MATQLFLLNTAPDTHLGANNVSLGGFSVTQWKPLALGISRGSGVVASDNPSTVTGATSGVEIAVSALRAEWISPPVAADVTISGTITANIWASESNMSANVAINVVIEIIRANDLSGTESSNKLVQIVKSTNATEVAVTTRGVNNFTSGMTSYTAQTLNRGDRLRIRVFGDDVGTMASGYTFNIGYNGTTAAADGDTYVTFTENITFEGSVELVQADTSGGGVGVGSNDAFIQSAQAFTATGVLSQLKTWLSKTSSPVDNLIVEIQTDSAGSPSGTAVGTVATVSGASLTTTPTEFTYSGLSIALSPSTTYWVVFRRSSGVADVNAYSVRASTGLPSEWTARKFYNQTTTTWSSGSNSITVSLKMAAPPAGSVVYLTDTASAVSTASVDREAWTSRGAGVQTDVKGANTGWVAPLQLTDTAGGTVVDWFTRPLTAFTLTGMAVANLRASQTDPAVNASLRCEIARVDNDGTNATVWANWCIAPTGTDNGELTTSEVARTAYVSGDDLAITNGQRLRIRVYLDDMSSAAMVALGQQVTFYYAGTSAAASGDTYITFPQTLTEYVPAAPHIYIPVGFATGRDY